MGEIGTLWVKIGAKIDGLEKSLSDVDKATQKIGKNLTSVGNQMGLSGAAITASLGLMIKKTADFGDELWDLKQRTGIAADTLSSLKLAADKSGTSLGGIAIGLRFLGRSMADAAQGGKESAEAFRMIGVSVKDVAGNLRPMDDVMMDVADRFAGMEDGALKTSLAIKLFGRSGTELIPMLNLGREGIAELREEAQRLGIVISNEAASNADKFNDSTVSLKASLQGAGMAIATSLMPIVKSLTETITGIVSGVTQWAAKNGTLVQTLTGMVAGTGALLTVLGGLSVVLGTLMTKLPMVAAALGTTTGALIASTAVWTAGAAAVLYYLNILRELKSEIDKTTSASTKFNQANIDLSNKLYELVKVGAMSVTTYYELWDSFNGNAAAMAMYIKEGKAGVKAQEALVEIGKKHVAVIDAQKASTAGFNAEMATNNKLVATAVELSKSRYEWLYALGNIHWDVGNAGLADNMSLHPEVWRTQLAWLAGETKKTTASMSNYFDGLYNDIATGFANAMEGLFDGTQSFKDFFVSIWGTIKKAFFRVLAEMVAGFFVNFVKNIVAGMGIVKAATSAFGAFSAAAGTAGTAAASGATAASGAAVGAGAALGTMFTVGFIGVWASGFAKAIAGVFNWNKKKSPEQLAAEQAWIANLEASGHKWTGDWWMADSNAGERGRRGGRWATGFSGVITQPTTATFGEGGPERVTVTPLSGVGASASGGAISMNFYAPLITTTGITQRECSAAAEYIFNAVESQARRRGFSLAQ